MLVLLEHEAYRQSCLYFADQRDIFCKTKYWRAGSGSNGNPGAYAVCAFNPGHSIFRRLTFLVALCDQGYRLVRGIKFDGAEHDHSDHTDRSFGHEDLAGNVEGVSQG
ncbi:hypothetical protein [Polaromonas jejuensis]|uniref:Uncharacterized protein n=1 Tax=Polaromonas jejuensis TaxID=457502 RepID=A0ABW0QFI1_9BURK|nr:hypothetical protein [Polaromonas jejuensis]